MSQIRTFFTENEMMPKITRISSRYWIYRY